MVSPVHSLLSRRYEKDKEKAAAEQTLLDKIAQLEADVKSEVEKRQLAESKLADVERQLRDETNKRLGLAEQLAAKERQLEAAQSTRAVSGVRPMPASFRC